MSNVQTRVACSPAIPLGIDWGFDYRVVGVDHSLAEKPPAWSRVEQQSLLRPFFGKSRRAIAEANAEMDKVVAEMLQLAGMDDPESGLKIHVLRQKWTISGRKLIPIYQRGMEHCPYASLAFHPRQGFLGELFRSPYYKDDFIDFRPLPEYQIMNRFQWPARYQLLTRQIKAIRGVQIVCKTDAAKEPSRHQVFGLVSAYAETDEAADYLARPIAREAMRELGDTARVLYDFKSPKLNLAG
jgi:hypothetical protein